jgi:site-specific DNA recombinase
MEVPPIISEADFYAMQAALKARSPQWMPPRAVGGSDPADRHLLLRILRGRDDVADRHYYTCSTKARQGEAGCRGLTVPMDKLDRAVADHLEWRPLDPQRLASMMDQFLERRQEWNERRCGHIAELRKLAGEAEAKLKRAWSRIAESSEIRSLSEGSAALMTPFSIAS